MSKLFRIASIEPKSKEDTYIHYIIGYYPTNRYTDEIIRSDYLVEKKRHLHTNTIAHLKKRFDFAFFEFEPFTFYFCDVEEAQRFIEEVLLQIDHKEQDIDKRMETIRNILTQEEIKHIMYNVILKMDVKSFKASPKDVLETEKFLAIYEQYANEKIDKTNS